MRHRLLVVLALASLSAPAALDAQQPAPTAQPAQPGVVVVSYNKCAVDAPPKIDSLSTLAFYPILDELVRENRLMGWGVLTHGWGDEWNYIIYYTAANTAAFHSAWGEVVQRLQRRRPTSLTELAAHCSEHRDNIYSVMRVGAAPPAPR